MNLTEFFEQGYFYFVITVFGLLLVLGTFLTALLKTNKLPIIQLVLLVLFVLIALFKPLCVWVFHLKPELKDFSMDFDFYTTILCGVLVLISHAAYLVFTSGTLSGTSIYMLAPSNLGKTVYAYINQNGKVLSLTEEFFVELNVSFKEQKKWYKEVNDFQINGISYDYSSFFAKIKDLDDTVFKVTFILEEEEVTLNIRKVTVEKDEELIGYILTAPYEELVATTEDGFANVYKELDTPVAYYNNDKRGIILSINDSFKDLVGIKGVTLSYDELRNFVYAEDINLYNSCVNERIESKTYCYRLQTNEGIKMFEEIKKFNGEFATVIITLAKASENKLCEKTDLVKVVDQDLLNKKEFGACLISLNDIEKIYDSLGVDVTKELINKYINYLQKSLLKDDDLICRISDMEYCLLIKDILTFDSIVRDIRNNSSDLLQYSIQYNNEKFILSNIVGLVYSEHVSSGNELMNALDASLSFANKETYDKNYSIYAPTSKKENKSNEEEYNFDNYKIDLDNSFLDDDDKK